MDAVPAWIVELNKYKDISLIAEQFEVVFPRMREGCKTSEEVFWKFVLTQGRIVIAKKGLKLIHTERYWNQLYKRVLNFIPYANPTETNTCISLLKEIIWVQSVYNSKENRIDSEKVYIESFLKDDEDDL